MKRNRATFTLGELGDGKTLQPFLAVFDHRDLQGQTDLMGGESRAGSGVHGFAHVFPSTCAWRRGGFLLARAGAPTIRKTYSQFLCQSHGGTGFEVRGLRISRPPS
jgi:hypothetical protein